MKMNDTTVSDTTGKLLSSDVTTEPVQSVGSHRVGNCPFTVVTQSGVTPRIGSTFTLQYIMDIFIAVENTPKLYSEMPPVKVVCTCTSFGCSLKTHEDDQGETQPGDKVSKATRSRHRKRDNELLTTAQTSIAVRDHALQYSD